MNKKIVTSALLTTLAIFTFVGCGKKKTTNKTNNNTTIKTTFNKTTNSTTKKATTAKKTTTEKKIEVVDGNYLYANDNYLTHAIIEDGKLKSLKLFSGLTTCYIITPTIVDGKFEKITMTLPLDSEFSESYLVLNKGNEFTPFEKVQYNLGNNRHINLNTIRVSDDRIEIKSLNETTTIYLNGEMNDSTKVTGEISFDGATVSYNNNVINATYNFADIFTKNYVTTIEENKVVTNIDNEDFYTTEINGKNIICKYEYSDGEEIHLSKSYEIKLDDNGYISTYSEPVWNGMQVRTFTYSNNYKDIIIHFDNPGDDPNDDWDRVCKLDDFRREIVYDGYTTTYDTFGNITKYSCSDYECVYAFNSDNTPKSRLNYDANDGEEGYYLSYSEFYTFDNLGRFVAYKSVDNTNNDKIISQASITYDDNGNILSQIDESYDEDGKLNSWSSKAIYTYKDGKPINQKRYSVNNHEFYVVEEIVYYYEVDYTYTLRTSYDVDGNITNIKKEVGMNTVSEEIFEYNDGKINNYKYVEYIVEDSSSVFSILKIDYCVEATYDNNEAVATVTMYVNDFTNNKYTIYTIKNDCFNDKNSWKDVTNYTETETKSGVYTLKNQFIWK